MGLGRIFLSALAIILGVATSVYFFISWWRHRDKKKPLALLYWAIALFLMYWFQAPAIFVSFGKSITVTDFNFFFALTLPITFLALILVYSGLIRLAGINLNQKYKILFAVWFLIAVLFFGYHFFIKGGIIKDYLLPIAGNVAFYVPIRILIIVTVLKLFCRPGLMNVYGILGVAGIVTEAVLGLMRNFFILKTVMVYPPSFWYLAILDSPFFLVAQTASVLLFVFGFFFLHLAQHGSRRELGQ